MSEWNQNKINHVVKQYIRNILENDEKCRSMPRNSSEDAQTLEGKTFLEASDMKADEAHSLLTSVNRWLRNQDHSLMYPVVKRFAPELSPTGNDYQALSRELLIAFQNILRVRIKRSESDYSQPCHNSQLMSAYSIYRVIPCAMASLIRS